MATSQNFKSAYKVGYTEAEILANKAREYPHYLSIHCLNKASHKHGDRNPSAIYRPDSGWYQCYGCGLKGFANDRNHPDWKKPQKRTYSNGVQVKWTWRKGQKVISQHHTQTTQAQALSKPYGCETIHPATRTIYIVEGEKCVDVVRAHLDPKSEAVVTSRQGSNAAHKTDWSPVMAAIKEGDCGVVLLPDHDAAGEKYIGSVAGLLQLTEMQVIRVGKESAQAGYDIADWLEEGHKFADLPLPTVEPNHNTPLETHGFLDLFGYHRNDLLLWIAKDMIPVKKPTLLVGRSGIGKSTMALYIASCVSRGIQPFTQNEAPPDLIGDNNKVLIYSTEDDWNDTVGVRLKMMDAEMQNIAPLFSQHDRRHSFKWHDATEMQLLLEALHEMPVRLLVIDPLIDIIGGMNNNDPATIREAIETLINPILATGCTVLGIHHERKDARREDLLADRVLGSQAWNAISRSILHMQALPKAKALGSKGKKSSPPRQSLDTKFKISAMDLSTNSDVMGVIVCSKSNLAKVDGGYHYELPTEIPKGQISTFTRVAINTQKITNRTPEELVQIYNPVAPDQAPESAVNRQARVAMAERIEEKKSAEAVIKQIFREHPDEKMKMKELQELVMEAAGVGRDKANAAIRALTKAEHEGNNWWRELRKQG